jgi:hypothetical protein
MLNSSLMEKEYDHEVINFSKNIRERADTL